MLQKKRAEREAAELANFQEIAKKIASIDLQLTLEAGEKGKVFGAITNQQIADALAAQGVEIDRHCLDLEKPLRKSGSYEIAAKLHPQVTATVRVHLEITGEIETPAETPSTAEETAAK